MLVVLTVMGLFIGLVSAILRPDERSALRVEAERLSQLLDLAATEARLTGQSIAWAGESSGYRFLRAGEDAAWSEIQDSELLRARALPAGITVSGFLVENMRRQGGMRLEFAPHGATLAFTIGLSVGKERYVVQGSPIGEVRVVPGDGAVSGGGAQR